MRKRLISICTIVILLYGIYGCAKTDEDVSVAETESVKTENTETESKEADSVDTTVGSEETALSENENGQNKELAEPIYIIEPQLTQDDTYEMQDWQVAYAEYIEGLEWKENYDYSLIYVDDDDIPELVIDTGIEANGCYILTFYNGDVDVFRTARLNFYYIEKQNLINNSDGHMGYYYDSVYSIENGKWVYAAGGVWTETYVMEDDDLVYQYEWEGEPVEEEVYADELNIIFDMEQAKHPEQYERLDEMLFRLQTGTALSQTHRYELYIEDVTWDEARRRCEEKGGYLATITTIEEYEHVKKGIGDSGQTQVAYWVGAYDKYPSSQPVYRWHEPDLDYWDETFISHTFMKKYWADGEPSYCRHADDEQVDRLCVYILYDDATEDCYLYDAPMDMLMRNPGYAGKIGYICEYDSITVMAKETKYYSDGSIGRWSEYEYSGAGNLTKEICHNADGTIHEWYGYEYDSAGNQIKQIQYYDDDSVGGWTESEYDSAGNEVKRISYDADGSIRCWWEYKYDGTENVIKEIYYNAGGSINWWWENEYDSAGNRVKYIHHDKVDNIDYWYEYKYDSEGNRERYTLYNADGSVKYWCKYEYDSAGNEVKNIEYGSNGSLLYWYEYEYDSAGNRMRYILYDEDDSISHWYEYEYITITPQPEAAESNQ